MTFEISYVKISYTACHKSKTELLDKRNQEPVHFIH